MLEFCQRIYDLLDEIRTEAEEKTYLLVAHNGVSRVVQSYFFDMSNEEYAKFGIGNCEIRRYEFGQEAEAMRQRKEYRFYIRRLEKPESIIGVIGLNEVVWGAFCSCFLGYKMDQAYCGKGYMTMAVSMITEYAFSELGLHRLEANVMPKNVASLKVLEKNGYENEGLLKRYLKINGVWEDHYHMVKRNEEME